MLQRYNNTVLQGYNNAVLQRHNNAVLQRYNNTVLQGYNNAVLQRYNNTVLQRYTNAVLQRNNNAVLQRYTNAVLQRNNNAVLQRYTNAVLQRYNNNMLHILLHSSTICSSASSIPPSTHVKACVSGVWATQQHYLQQCIIHPSQHSCQGLCQCMASDVAIKIPGKRQGQWVVNCFVGELSVKQVTIDSVVQLHFINVHRDMPNQPHLIIYKYTI